MSIVRPVECKENRKILADDSSVGNVLEVDVSCRQE